MKSAVPLSDSPAAKAGAASDIAAEDYPLSPLYLDLLDSPERAMLEQLQAPGSPLSLATDPPALQQRLQNIATNLEFSIDSFAHGVHALSTVQKTAERLVDKTLASAADTLEEREKVRRGEGAKSVDALSALKALGKIMNGKKK